MRVEGMDEKYDEDAFEEDEPFAEREERLDADERLTRAQELFQQAYTCQQDGKFERAIRLYKKSIEAYPTAEAHPFLGWTYSFQGRPDDAIAASHKAIEVGPAFG